MEDYRSFSANETEPEEKRDPNEQAREFLALLQDPEAATAIDATLRKQLLEALSVLEKSEKKEGDNSLEMRTLMESLERWLDLEKLEGEPRQEMIELVASLSRDTTMVAVSTKVNRQPFDYANYPLLVPDSFKPEDLEQLGKDIILELSWVGELSKLHNNGLTNPYNTAEVFWHPNSYENEKRTKVVSLPYRSSAFDAGGRPAEKARLTAILDEKNPEMQLMLEGKLNPSKLAHALYLIGLARNDGRFVREGLAKILVSRDSPLHNEQIGVADFTSGNTMLYPAGKDSAEVTQYMDPTAFAQHISSKLGYTKQDNNRSAAGFRVSSYLDQANRL